MSVAIGGSARHLGSIVPFRSSIITTEIHATLRENKTKQLPVMIFETKNLKTSKIDCNIHVW